MNAPRDIPARLVALAAAWMPAERCDWGRAMVAELTQVEGRAARWRFAAGSMRVALTPRRPGRHALSTLLALGVLIVLLSPPALAPSTSTGWWVRASWMLGDVVASVTLCGLFRVYVAAGHAASRTTARVTSAKGSNRLRRVVVLAVVGAAALDAFVLLHYPEVRREGTAGALGYVATAIVSGAVVAILGSYAWLAFRRTRGTSAAGAVAQRYGLAAGGVAGVVLVAAPHIGVPGVAAWAAAGVVAAISGRLASRTTADAGAGAAAGTWAGVVAGLALFVVGGLVTVAGPTSHSPTVLADFHQQAGTAFTDLRSFTLAGAFGLDGDPPLAGALVSLVFVPLLCAGWGAFASSYENARPSKSPLLRH